jgi:VanZ family protein
MRVAQIRRLDPWLAPLVLMAVIFALSAQPNLNSGLGVIDAVGRKFVHLGEYALLTLLWARAFATRMSFRRAVLFALLLSSAYASTDEFHQEFVRGRHASPIDWAIDTAGATLAAAYLLRIRSRARSRT